LPSPDPSAANPYAAPAAESHRAEGKYTFVRNPRFLTNLLVGLLVIFLFKKPFFMIERIVPLLPQRSFSYPGVTQLNIAATIAPVIVFIIWIYLTAANARGFRAQGMRYSPAGAIGWYFVPILNLFLPYRAMKEIWQVSGDPGNWQAQRGSPILVIWWTIWVAFNLYLAIAIIYDLTSYSSVRATYIFVDIIGMFFYFAFTVIGILLVLTITRRQEALVAASGNKEG